MYELQTRRSERLFGLRQETINDIVALSILIFGVLLFLSLATQTANGNLIGRLGEMVYGLLSFVFGIYVAYVPVLLILGWGVSFWSGRRWRHVPARVAGMFAAMVWVCAMLALPYAETDFSKQEGFRVGGAIGNFLVHTQCLNLKGTFGPVGCWILFGGGLVISVLVAADIQLRPLLSRVWESLRRLSPSLLFSRWAESRAGFDRIANSMGLEAVEEGEALNRMEIVTRPLPREEPQAVDPEAPTPAWFPPKQKPTDLPKSEEKPAASAPPSSLILEPPEPAIKKVPVSPSDGLITTSADEDQHPDDLVALAQQKAAETETAVVYEAPPVELFREPVRSPALRSAEENRDRSQILEQTLAQFDVHATVVNVEQGPTVTCFELELEPGIKVSRIAGLEDNIAMAMKAESVRIIAPIPGKGTVGLEIPNRKRMPVFLREILETEKFRSHPSPLAFALGKTITGEPYICDLAQMPHLLIAGTTGSGKSVCLNAIICSILYRMEPDRVKFILIDPKRVELNVYRDIPHLLAPVVCDAKKSVAALGWAVVEMESRYKKLEALGVRNIDGYNAIVCSERPHPKAIGQRLEYMPHIVIVVDELSDLMVQVRNDVEDSIVRLAQMSRAVGMHLIVATQRPSVNVITGIIKANFPCRIAFQVSSKVDSRTILDCGGAESLLGRGDMLFSMAGAQKPIRIQGCYVSDEEVERLTNYLRQQARPTYMPFDFGDLSANAGAGNPLSETEGMAEDESASAKSSHREGSGGTKDSTFAEDGPDAIDEILVRDAIRVILSARCASTSLLQRRLRVGFARAGRIMDIIEERGIVGPSVGPKPREILVDPAEYLQQLEEEESQHF